MVVMVQAPVRNCGGVVQRGVGAHPCHVGVRESSVVVADFL
jgi:hypothetical protein